MMTIRNMFIIDQYFIQSEEIRMNEMTDTESAHDAYAFLMTQWGNVYPTSDKGFKKSTHYWAQSRMHHNPGG